MIRGPCLAPCHSKSIQTSSIILIPQEVDYASIADTGAGILTLSVSLFRVLHSQSAQPWPQDPVTTSGLFNLVQMPFREVKSKRSFSQETVWYLSKVRVSRTIHFCWGLFVADQFRTATQEGWSNSTASRKFVLQSAKPIYGISHLVFWASQE